MEKDFFDHEDFSEIRDSLDNYSSVREDVIKGSRVVLKDSKRAIYAASRGDLPAAEMGVLKMSKDLVKLISMTSKDPRLRFEGSLRVAAQEYVEAACYVSFLKDGVVPSKKDLGINEVEYLGGICDFTGELVRAAVGAMIEKRYSDVSSIREVIAEVYGLFLDLELPNGDLRRKADSLRHNLNKVEDLLVGVKITGE